MFNFKSIVSAASVVASALVIGFSAPALAGSCDSVKEFAQSLEQTSGQKPIVECYEQKTVPAQVPSHEGVSIFLSLAALLAGGWGVVAALNMNKIEDE